MNHQETKWPQLPWRSVVVHRATCPGPPSPYASTTLRVLNSQIKLKTAAMVNRPSCALFQRSPVDRGPSPFLSKIEAYDRGQLLTHPAHGVMLAATGSTAYSVSAGVLVTRTFAILMTPISYTPFFHLSSSPIRSVELRVSENARNSAWVSFDGRER